MLRESNRTLEVTIELTPRFGDGIIGITAARSGQKYWAESARPRNHDPGNLG